MCRDIRKCENIMWMLGVHFSSVANIEQIPGFIICYYIPTSKRVAIPCSSDLCLSSSKLLITNAKCEVCTDKFLFNWNMLHFGMHLPELCYILGGKIIGVYKMLDKLWFFCLKIMQKDHSHNNFDHEVLTAY